MVQAIQAPCQPHASLSTPPLARSFRASPSPSRSLPCSLLPLPAPSFAVGVLAVGLPRGAAEAANWADVVDVERYEYDEEGRLWSVDGTGVRRFYDQI